MQSVSTVSADYGHRQHQRWVDCHCRQGLFLHNVHVQSCFIFRYICVIKCNFVIVNIIQLNAKMEVVVENVMQPSL